MSASSSISRPPTAAAAHEAHRSGGYDYAQVRDMVADLGYTAHIRPRGEEAQAKKAG